MDKHYDHKKNETEIYSLWEKTGAFIPKIDKNKKPFTIIMPPPNASDPLHIGHARFIAIEDILTRYHRMRGEPTLWLPGADHAGIETQYVFEKRLAKKGKSRFDYDRDTLYKMIWDYVIQNKKTMENQLKILGASCDWSRNKFTLDSDIIKIVYIVFKKLYDDGLVYRGEKVVNYCPSCGTSFSQLEVNYVERDDPFYFLDYETLTIATTRPETIFADVAIAVNPKDKRYKNLIGKTAKLPIVGRRIPILADSLVDPDFGTGALKVTPGHDATDFEIGQKHKLPTVSVIDKEGKMINTPKNYIGLPSLKAREQVIKDLKKSKKIKKIKTIHHALGRIEGEEVAGPLFYLKILILFPASVFSVGYLIVNLKESLNSKKAQLIVWVLIYVLVLVVSVSKHEWYLVPLISPLSILAAAFVYQLERLTGRKIIKIILRAFILVIFLAAPSYLLTNSLPQPDTYAAVRIMQKESLPVDTLYLWEDYELIPITRFFPGRSTAKLQRKSVQGEVARKERIFVLLKREDKFDIPEVGEETVLYEGNEDILIKITSAKRRK